jgi:hypothetical protein
MDLKQTIAELEAQAARYTDAANALRALLDNEGAVALPATRAPRATKAAAAPVAADAADAAAPKRRGRKKGSKRGPVSEETRRKIAEALRAKHAEKKALKG